MKNVSIKEMVIRPSKCPIRGYNCVGCKYAKSLNKETSSVSCSWRKKPDPRKIKPRQNAKIYVPRVTDVKGNIVKTGDRIVFWSTSAKDGCAYRDHVLVFGTVKEEIIDWHSSQESYGHWGTKKRLGNPYWRYRMIVEDENGNTRTITYTDCKYYSKDATMKETKLRKL